jgi:hypothetical protein
MNSDSRLSAGRVFLLASVCSCALALGSASAGAQDGAEDPAYKELIEQALSEFKHKNWPEARVLFMHAHERNPNARTSRGMGVVSFEMRDYLNAVVNLKAALEDTRQPLTEAQRKECESLLARARTYVGVFTVKLDPPDAYVLLDGGAPNRDEAGRLLVPFGEHVVSASAPGRQATSIRLNVQGGERGEVSLLLPREQPASTAAPVQRDASGALPPQPERETGSTPSQAGRPRQAHDGFVGHGLKFTWIALGASALFGGTAGLMWRLGDKKLDDLDRRCRERADTGSPCTRDNTGADRVKRYEMLTNASLGVSGAALAAFAVLMGLEWPRERNLSLGVGRDSLLLRGAF